MTWAEVCSLAVKAGAKYPELVAAQYALESGWGYFQSGKNNFFGIKGQGTKKETKEFVNGKEVTIVAEFQDFDSPIDCIQYLVDKWYKDYKSYKGVNNAANRNEAARMLVTEKYATDPNYADKLIQLMSHNAAPIELPKVPVKSPINLKQAAAYYVSDAHQNKAWDFLQSCLTETQLNKFAELYRAKKESSADKFPLKVPYYYQRDSKTGHGERSCQSSAIAMVLEYLNPDLINGDDDYLGLVFRYGDTVSQSAHKKALGHLGVKNSFKMDGRSSDVIRLLDLGIPVPIGILHRGSLGSPTGGGHYVALIGYDSKYYYVHDPFGELDLINGGYPKNGPTDGKNQRYSRANLEKRWLINNDHDGWYWSFEGNAFRKP